MPGVRAVQRCCAADRDLRAADGGAGGLGDGAPLHAGPGPAVGNHPDHVWCGRAATHHVGPLGESAATAACAAARCAFAGAAAAADRSSCGAAAAAAAAQHGSESRCLPPPAGAACHPVCSDPHGSWTAVWQPTLRALHLPCSDPRGLCVAGRLLQLAAGPAAGRHLRPHLPPVRRFALPPDQTCNPCGKPASLLVPLWSVM